MWAEVATGSVFIGLLGVILRLQDNRMGNLEDKMVFRDPCKARHDAIEKDLKRGEGEFKELRKLISDQGETLAQHGECLARIDERTERLVKQNGA